MALTPSSMVSLGSLAPAFRLPDTLSSKELDREQLRGPKGLLLMFICNHCPFVQHIEDELVAFGREWADSGVGIVAVSSNDVITHPEDHPEKMRQRGLAKDYPFPYLYDESQQLAMDCDATCTPDFFLYGPSLECVYRGRFDASTPGNDAEVTGEDLRQAMASGWFWLRGTNQSVTSPTRLYGNWAWR